MPIMTCPHCDSDQSVPRELIGLKYTCKACGQEFKAEERGARIVKDRLVDSFDMSAIWKSVKFLLFLLIPVGVILIIAYFVVTSQQKAERERNAPKTVEQKKQEAEQKQRDEEESAKTKAKVIVGFGIGLLILIMIGVAIYVFLLVTMGAWIAKDAFARGMSGLGWASFYYLFHFFSRVLIVGLSLTPALVPFGIGLFSYPVAELVSWMGFFTYMYARKRGRLTTCKDCGNRRLVYLSLCPHCGK